jgi:hypothetical protein
MQRFANHDAALRNVNGESAAASLVAVMTHAVSSDGGFRAARFSCRRPRTKAAAMRTAHTRSADAARCVRVTADCGRAT